MTSTETGAKATVLPTSFGNGPPVDTTYPPPPAPYWRFNEADKIVLDRLDTSHQWIEWFTNLCDTVASASGRPDECHEWMMEIEDSYATEDEAWNALNNTGQFSSIDSKLKTALKKIVYGQLKERLDLEE